MAAVVRQSTQWSCKVACLMHAVTSAQVVIDAFRLINPQTMMLGQEPRQTTSNLGHLEKPSIQVTRLSSCQPYGLHWSVKAARLQVCRGLVTAG